MGQTHARSKYDEFKTRCKRFFSLRVKKRKSNPLQNVRKSLSLPPSIFGDLTIQKTNTPRNIIRKSGSFCVGSLKISERKSPGLNSPTRPRSPTWKLVDKIRKRKSCDLKNLQLKYHSSSHDQELLIAIQKKDLDAVKNIIQFGKPQINMKHTNLEKQTALHIATSLGLVSVMQLLIEYGANVNASDVLERTPLHLAVTTGLQEGVVLLLGNGASVNVRDLYGNSPLHLAVKGHHFAIANDLLLFGANVNFKKEDGMTCLHEACINKDPEAVEYLINLSSEYKLMFNLKDESGETPLFKAIASGSRECIKKLLIHKKMINWWLRNESGMNIVHTAVENEKEECLTTLHVCGLITERLLNEGDTVHKNTPLHYAVQKKNIRIVERLLEIGADVYKRNEDGETPAQLALRLGEEKIYEKILGYVNSRKKRMTC